MASLTIRDIPDEVMEMLKALSKRERRSLNKEFIVVVERGLKTTIDDVGHGMKDDRIPLELQAGLWDQLCGKWEDSRSTSEIVADIRDRRTLGREVQL